MFLCPMNPQVQRKKEETSTYKSFLPYLSGVTNRIGLLLIICKVKTIYTSTRKLDDHFRSGKDKGGPLSITSFSNSMQGKLKDKSRLESKNTNSIADQDTQKISNRRPCTLNSILPHQALSRTSRKSQLSRKHSLDRRTLRDNISWILVLSNPESST